MQSLEHGVNLSRVEEIELVGEDVEADSEARAGLVDVGEDGFDSHRAENLEVGDGHERIAPLRFQCARDVDDVLALVAVGGHRGVDAVRLEIAHADRFAEQLHLAAAVVEIIFARDVEAGRLVQARDRVAEHGVAAVADGHGSGGIGGEKLDLDFLASARTQLPRARLPECAAGARGSAHLGMPVRRRHFEIDEAGTGDRDLADFGGQRDVRFDYLGDRARRFALGLRERQRDVRGDVAVGGIARRFDSDRRNFGSQLTSGARPPDCVAKDGDDQFFHCKSRGRVPQSCQIDGAMLRRVDARGGAMRTLSGEIL